MTENNYGRRKWYIAAIICCFAPFAGIFVIIPMAIYEFKHRQTKNKGILYSAIACMIFSLFMAGYVFFVSLSIGPEFLKDLWFLIVYFLIPSVLSVMLFIIYVIHSKRSNRLSKLKELIRTDHITFIPLLSEILGTDDKTTKKYIILLKKSGFLSGAYIDERQNEIAFRTSIWAHQMCICQNCGAEISVNFGQTLICDYCGGALDVKRVNASANQ